MVAVIPLSGPLAYTRKNRIPTMGICDVVDQLHDDDCFADASATKHTNLATFDVRGE